MFLAPERRSTDYIWRFCLTPWASLDSFKAIKCGGRFFFFFFLFLTPLSRREGFTFFFFPSREKTPPPPPPPPPPPVGDRLGRVLFFFPSYRLSGSLERDSGFSTGKTIFFGCPSPARAGE